MKSFFCFVFTVGTIALYSSCSTTTSVTPNNLSKTDLLAKSWVLSATFINDKESTSQWESCTKDDLLVFRKDNTYERNEGSIKCANKDNQIFEQGTWGLTNSDSELVLNKSKTYKILTLTDKSLVISSKNIWGETEEFAYKAF